MDDLISQLRGAKIDSIADVEFAVLETSGQLSVLEKDSTDSPEQTKDQTKKSTSEALATSLANKIKYEELPFSLIMDGRVNDKNLRIIGKTRSWLKNQLQAKGVKDFKDIFYCSLDHTGELYINTKDERWD